MSNLTTSTPLTLKCGLTLSNRLVKVAMAEGAADENNKPGNTLETIFDAWAEGGWGLVITGNVQVDSRYLGGPRDVAFDRSLSLDEQAQSWQAWARRCRRNGTAAIVQINHPGRQSPAGSGDRSYCTKNLAPSAVPLRLGDGLVPKALSSLIFGTPKEMTVSEIQDVVQGFADTASLAAKSGFSGVEIHAAHGYLLAQFLSSKTNLRTDFYGGTATARARIVVEIIQAIRAVVPREFCVGLKFNSVDHQSSRELEDCIKQLQMITEAGIDFLEISGGSYEDFKMVGLESEKSSRTKAREAFFLDFARAIRSDFPKLPLIVTGGFRTRKGMESAVSEGSCELIGIGRPAATNPTLPKSIILNPDIADNEAKVQLRKVVAPWYVKHINVKGVGEGVESTWYGKKIRELGQN